MERFLHIIQSRVALGDWKPIKASQKGPGITHLFFADDLILFSTSASSQIAVVKKSLEKFSLWSGQTVSFVKSKIFISKNLGTRRAREVSREVGMPMLWSRVVSAVIAARRHPSKGMFFSSDFTSLK